MSTLCAESRTVLECHASFLQAVCLRMVKRHCDRYSLSWSYSRIEELAQDAVGEAVACFVAPAESGEEPERRAVLDAAVAGLRAAMRQPEGSAPDERRSAALASDELPQALPLLRYAQPQEVSAALLVATGKSHGAPP